MQDRRNTPTWDWVAGIAILILIGIAGYSYSDTQDKIKLKADKETVDRMYEDVRDIKAIMTSHIIKTGACHVERRSQ